MPMPTSFSAHILLLAFPAWGHVRPLAAFACKAVQERQDIVITLLTAGSFGERTELEITRYLSGPECKSMERIRVVALGGPGLTDIQLHPNMIKAFGGYYEKLLRCQPIQCSLTGRTYEAVCKPTAAIIDFFLFPILQTVRSMSGRDIPAYSWSTANAFAFLRVMGPEHLGGFGDIPMKARTLAEEAGKPVEQIMDELYTPSSGVVVNIPGLPPMYDYEWYPQEIPPEIPRIKLFSAAYNFVNECDGIVSTSSSAFEYASIDALRAWFADTKRKVFAVGPLMPPGFGSPALSGVVKQTEIYSTKNGWEIENFLDQTLRNHGKQSLIYVSFGTYWWPKNEYVWVLVDALLEHRLPFILSHASPKAKIPPGYSEKVKASGLGLLSAWTPQQLILNHPATGWFLTHCGQNSVMEALSQGIPMIVWPLGADQPANAAHLTLTLDAAFELLEVRLGLGLKPLHRGVQPAGTVDAVEAEVRSVLRRANGPEGQRKRHNAETLKDHLRKQWEEGGEAITDLRSLLAEVSIN